MSERFEWDDTNSSGIWWSTNVSIRDECILLKEDTQCEDSDIVELLRSIAQNIEDNGPVSYTHLTLPTTLSV